MMHGKCDLKSNIQKSLYIDVKCVTYNMNIFCCLLLEMWLNVNSKYSLLYLEIILNIAIKYICIIVCLPLNFPIVQSPSHLK
jgi:hypothetical protein